MSTVSFDGLLGHCSTCRAAMVEVNGVMQNEVVEVVYDDDGQRWITPHKKDCPRWKL